MMLLLVLLDGCHYFSIDASLNEEFVGRFVNDDHISPNSTMKLVSVNDKPHLCLFAIRHIYPGEEIRYNYGSGNYPWRKVSWHFILCPNMYSIGTVRYI